MARIFITGSTDGLGRAAARSLLDDGHAVVLHARSTERASTLADLASQAAGVVIGDLRSAAEIHRVAEQVNAIGRMNAVIHNAGIYMARRRGSLSSETKCNTPADLIIGTADQDLRECCHGMLFAFVG